MDCGSKTSTRSWKSRSAEIRLAPPLKVARDILSAFVIHVISATTSTRSRRVLVATPTGNQVPISLLADIRYRTGPPDIRDENGQLVGYVFVDITSSDINGYVQAASRRISERVQFPPGYYIQWAGQFQYLQAAEKRLAIVIPFTLLIIFVLIYLNTRSLTKTFIVLLTVPFSLIGAFWLSTCSDTI